MKTPGLYWHESEGNIKTKLKKISFIFFQFSKKWDGRVGKTKDKKLWPYWYMYLEAILGLKTE